MDQAEPPGDAAQVVAEPPPARPEGGGTGWIGWSVVSGCVLGVPAGWLLAYLSALPFLLGLFFYLLLGLIIGATMFRFGRRARTPSNGLLRAMGAGVALVVWGTSLYAEYHALPRTVDRQVRNSFRRSFAADERAKLQRATGEFTADYLSRRYPPGGFIGYLRWAAGNETMECPRVFGESTLKIRLPQRGILWLVRVSLALILVMWAVLSQVLGLAPSLRPPESGPVP